MQNTLYLLVILTFLYLKGIIIIVIPLLCVNLDFINSETGDSMQNIVQSSHTLLYFNKSTQIE